MKKAICSLHKWGKCFVAYWNSRYWYAVLTFDFRKPVPYWTQLFDSIFFFRELVNKEVTFELRVIFFHVEVALWR